MDKLAFLFPGQGSQRVGMGADLVATHPETIERYLAQADAASGLPIRARCLDGPLEELTPTEVAQPALFAVSLALVEVAREAGLAPDFVAGHSLGEYTAAVAAGALATGDGMRVVSRRGQLMAAIQAERPGTMAAIIGLSVEALRELCAVVSDAGAGVVVLANLNTPGQHVVSGEVAAVEQLVKCARSAGAEKALRLPVGAAFHSPLMTPVKSRLGELTATLAWADTAVPLAANATGELLTDGAAIHQALLAQIASSVRWVDCIQVLLRAGCTTFLELGPGRVLTGLVRQIDRDVDVAAADSAQKLAAFIKARPGLVRA